MHAQDAHGIHELREPDTQVGWWVPRKAS